MKIIVAAFTFILAALTISSCRERLYTMPSSSMANTILPLEHIYVSHSKSFERNDVVVFNVFAADLTVPPDENGEYKNVWQKRVSRLVAVSGDSIQITKGDLYVNGKIQPLPPDALGRYYVKSTAVINDFPAGYDLDAHVVKQTGDTILYLVRISATQAEEYRHKPAVVEVTKFIEPTMDPIMPPLATNCGRCPWSLDFYGPLRIPSPGETIIVDSSNYRLYQHIPGIQLGPHVIEEKLYFMLGDNRHGAEDSRFIGFISHSKMHGIVK